MVLIRASTQCDPDRWRERLKEGLAKERDLANQPACPVYELKPADRYRDLKAILKAIAVGKEEANPNAPSGASTAAPLAMTFIVLSRFGLFDFGCKTGLPIRMRKNTRNVNRLTFSGLKTKKRKICLDALTDSSSY